MSTDRYDWRIKKGLNVICLCRYAEIEDWPTTYSRVSINVKTAGQVMFLGHAPDLDSQWQTVVMTKSLPFTLACHETGAPVHRTRGRCNACARADGC